MNSTERRIWEIIRNNKSYKGIISGYRQKFKIPSKGFKKVSELVKWRSTFDKKEYWKIREEFFDKIYKKFEVLNIERIQKIVLYSLYYSVVDDMSLERPYGLDFYFLIIKKKKAVPPGFYIKINPLAPRSEIRSFVNETTSTIEEHQLMFRRMLSLNEKVKVKLPPKNTERDKTIYTLSLMSNKELAHLSENAGESGYKDIMIANILPDFGYKNRLSPENVRTIIARERKKVIVTKRTP